MDKNLRALFLGSCFAISVINVRSMGYEEEWLRNIPSSPIQVSVGLRKNSLVFHNISRNEVAVIRLGIVTFDTGRYRILSVRSNVLINGKLPGGEAQISGLANHLKDIDLAQKMGGRLAVISVEFSDGSIWQANRDCKIGVESDKVPLPPLRERKITVPGMRC